MQIFPHGCRLAFGQRRKPFLRKDCVKDRTFVWVRNKTQPRYELRKRLPDDAPSGSSVEHFAQFHRKSLLRDRRFHVYEDVAGLIVGR